MSEILPSTPNGHVVFCDEIRQEANGKLFLIGMYQNEIFISPGFPAKLGSFSAIINYEERPGDRTSDVVLRLFLPGEESASFEAKIARSDLNAVAMPDDPEAEDPRVRVGIIAQFRDLVIKQSGRIRVRAYIGEDQLRLGSITIKQAPHPLNAIGVAEPPPKEAAN